MQPTRDPRAGSEQGRSAISPGLPAGGDLVLVVVAWMAFAALVSRGHLVTTYDSFRDMAGAHAWLRGEWGGDPTVPGLPGWYPPGNPALFATVAKLLGVPVLQVYGTSLFWFSWTLPVALHLLVTRAAGRAVAWTALAFVALGSRWWLTHLAMPMPSIQGVALGAFTLWVWLSRSDRGWMRSVVTGGLGTLATVHHPLCGGFAMAAILMHGLLPPLLRRRSGSDLPPSLGSSLLAGAVWAAASAPVLLPLLVGRVRNAAPRLWFGPELLDPRFALQAETPLVPLLGLVGLVLCARRWGRLGWLVAYAGVAFAGTVAGYAGHVLHWPVPYLIPHEFQWHLQLALCIAGAVATSALARRWPAGRAGPAGSGLVIALLALGPALFHLPDASKSVLRLDDERWDTLRQLASEVTRHAPPGAILGTEPELAYFLAGIAGTRAQLLPEGHLNPRASVPDRVEALRTLLQTGDEQRFAAALERMPVERLLQMPADSTELRELERRYHGWSLLRRIPLSDPTVYFFAVDRGSHGPPPPLERSLP